MPYGLTHAVCCLVLSAVIAGCSSLQPKTPAIHYSPNIAQLLTGEALLGHAVNSAELPNLPLFAITEEMAAFADNAIKPGRDRFQKVKLLHQALLSSTASGGRGIVYNAYDTQTPITTFAVRQANCLSFSLLYVALARHLGLNAQINEVEIPPTWDLRNNNALLFMRHVNVKILLHKGDGLSGLDDDNAVIDLDMKLYKAHYPQHAISDSLTAAQFYNNRSMELAHQGKLSEAFLNVRKALQQDDQQSYIWNNLASLFAQHNLPAAAESIYLHGLAINPHDLSITSNLAALYDKKGDKQQANIFHALALQHRQINPYYQYMLAISASDMGDTKNALIYLDNAFVREKKDIRFYQLAAKIYTNTGDNVKAEKMLKKIQTLAADKK